LAFAVFDENFDELEAIAAYPSREAFGRLWSRLLDLTIEALAFVEVVVDARRVPWAVPCDATPPGARRLTITNLTWGDEVDKESTQGEELAIDLSWSSEASHSPRQRSRRWVLP
jgi:hypothetical protein